MAASTELPAAPASPRARRRIWTAAPLDVTVFQTDVDAFTQVINELTALRRTWAEDYLDQAHAREKLQPIMQAVRKLAADHERDRDLQTRLRLVQMKQEKLAHLCALLQVPAEEHLEPGIEDMLPEAVIAALDRMHEKLTEVLQARRTQLRELATKRLRLIHELGDTHRRTADGGAAGVAEEVAAAAAAATAQDPHAHVKKRLGHTSRHEAAFNADGTFVLEGKTYAPTMAAVRQLECDIERVQGEKERRKAMIVKLANEIVALLVNENLARQPIDAKVVEFVRTGDVKMLGLGIARIDQLVGRRDALIQEEARLEIFMEDVRTKLRLVEDRQALLNLVKNVEASAKAPHRLFGDSKKLVQESEFRKTALVRLLGMERVLHEALVDWHRSHGARFLYKGVDYLAAMEEDLRTRKIPDDFTRPRDMEESCSDFTYVVERACSRMMPGRGRGRAGSSGAAGAAGAAGSDWTAANPGDSADSQREREKRLLLSNGWLPPSADEAAVLGCHSGGGGAGAARRAAPPPSLAAASLREALLGRREGESPHTHFEYSGDAGASRAPAQASLQFVPPEVHLSRERCGERHCGGGTCAVAFEAQARTETGTGLLPPTAPAVFQRDPHLLLPAPPRVKADRVRLRRHQIDLMRRARHKCECRLDHAVALRAEREPVPAAYEHPGHRRRTRVESARLMAAERRRRDSKNHGALNLLRRHRPATGAAETTTASPVSPRSPQEQTQTSPSVG